MLLSGAQFSIGKQKQFQDFGCTGSPVYGRRSHAFDGKMPLPTYAGPGCA
jgi:hypothetical protein